MTAGNPLALYARWQVRDAFTKAVVTLLFFLVIGGVPLWFLLNGHPPAGIDSQERIEQMSRMIYQQALGSAMTLGALLLMSGVVSADRTKQHFRFLFARPVAPWAFYLQYFAISVMLFVACTTLVPVGFRFLVTPVPVLAVVKAAALYALLFGALALLCSVLVARDGVLLVLVVVVSMSLQQLAPSNALPRWAELLAEMLPPFGTAEALRTRWLTERSVETGDLTLVLLYALGMLVVALVLLRRVPLAR
ncbi:MAG: hypothetical protein OEW77_02600 [Gemmatimonadota bacterium]|nr:hypothetical protein [Gemmatimonadota bacterium]